MKNNDFSEKTLTEFNKISLEFDESLHASLNALVDPIDFPGISVSDILTNYGIPMTLQRSVLVSACLAYYKTRDSLKKE